MGHEHHVEGGESLGDRAQEATEAVRDQARAASGTLRDLARDTGDKLKSGASTAGRKLGQAATSVRERAGGVADLLETAGERLEKGEFPEIRKPLEDLLRRRPFAVLLTSVGAGYLIARALRR
jgi:hypothetical protein